MTCWTWSGRERALPKRDLRPNSSWLRSVPILTTEGEVRTRRPPGRMTGAGTEPRRRRPVPGSRISCFTRYPHQCRQRQENPPLYPPQITDSILPETMPSIIEGTIPAPHLGEGPVGKPSRLVECTGEFGPEVDEGDDRMRDRMQIDRVGLTRIETHPRPHQEGLTPVIQPTLDRCIELGETSRRADLGEGDQSVTRMETIDPAVPSRDPIGPRAIAPLRPSGEPRGPQRLLDHLLITDLPPDPGEERGREEVRIVYDTLVEGRITEGEGTSFTLDPPQSAPDELGATTRETARLIPTEGLRRRKESVADEGGHDR